MIGIICCMPILLWSEIREKNVKLMRKTKEELSIVNFTRTQRLNKGERELFKRNLFIFENFWEVKLNWRIVYVSAKRLYFKRKFNRKFSNGLEEKAKLTLQCYFVNYTSKHSLCVVRYHNTTEKRSIYRQKKYLAVYTHKI